MKMAQNGTPARRRRKRVTTAGQNTGENTGRPRGRIENLKPWPKGVSGNPSGRTENLRPPWPKGVSGNPGGRPKRDVAAEIAQAVFEKNPEGIYDAMLRALKKGNPKAFAVLADRAFGKLREQVDMTHHDDFLAGRTREEKEFFAIHGYWPDGTDAYGNPVKDDQRADGLSGSAAHAEKEKPQ